MAVEPKGRLDVVERTHALIAWILPAVARFPRAHRYSLGARIESRAYGLLERLVRAAYLDRVRKTAALDDANVEVEVLRHEFRIAYSLRLVSAGQVEHATRIRAPALARVRRRFKRFSNLGQSEASVNSIAAWRGHAAYGMSESFIREIERLAKPAARPAHR